MSPVVTQTLRYGCDPVLQAAHDAIANCEIKDLKLDYQGAIDGKPALRMAARADSASGPVDIELLSRHGNLLAALVGTGNIYQGTITQGNLIVHPVGTENQDLELAFSSRLKDYLEMMTRVHDAVLDDLIARPEAVLSMKESWAVSHDTVEFDARRLPQRTFAVWSDQLTGHELDATHVRSIGPVFTYKNGGTDIRLFMGEETSSPLGFQTKSNHFIIDARYENHLVNIRTYMHGHRDIFTHVARAYPQEFEKVAWFGKPDSSL